MATPIANSRRIARLYCYTPVRLPDTSSEGGDLVGVSGLIRSLDIVPGELDGLQKQATTDEAKVSVRAIGALVGATTADQVLKATVGLADVKRSGLVGAIEHLRAIRSAALANATSALNPPPAPPTTPPPAADPGRPNATTTAQGSGSQHFVLAASRWKSSLGADLAADLGATPSLIGWRPQSVRLTAAAALTPPTVHPVTGAPPPVMSTRSGSVMSGIFSDRMYTSSDFTKFLVTVEPYIPPGTDLATLDPLDALAEIDRKAGACTIVIDALSRRNVQPLGLLHLESLEMTPTQVERGELVYSLPLAPREKVTLSHKEWAVRESEFTDFVQDSIENYSERGVAETDEIAISSQSESKKTERTGMGSSGGVVMTGPADAGSTVVTNTSSQQESRNHAKTVTSRASSRSVRDHKVSFTVATVSGTEDFTSRLIENPKDDRAMRVDYFRRMKSWKVDLYRTGVRLAYDVVIPDPGRRLRLRQDLIRSYDRALTGTFKPGLAVDDITRDNFMDYASAYGMELPAPPADADTSSVYKQWQMTCFAALRNGAYAKFNQVQERIRQRRAELAREIDSAADADMLRQMEREEIVRLTLAWVVPGFPGAGAVAGAAGEPQALSDSSWQTALEFGEYIKFVHAAIDWGRMTYSSIRTSGPIDRSTGSFCATPTRSIATSYAPALRASSCRFCPGSRRS
ncbi:MAG: hypothetical protein E6J90_22285 [Deltaproteobacteria bacterium]|nr:MAG: hypothetical protein E6J91_37635 [Deltaproteobacteria bacterium]TMQ17491.1 MAG: hypothetical protein E6J90_22285 [Deltaproteobacteria bacterium]